MKNENKTIRISREFPSLEKFLGAIFHRDFQRIENNMETGETPVARLTPTRVAVVEFAGETLSIASALHCHASTFPSDERIADEIVITNLGPRETALKSLKSYRANHPMTQENLTER